MKNISELEAVNARLIEIEHLLSLKDILLFSSNPNIVTVQTLQTERAKLLYRKRQLLFKEECHRIEASLPKFNLLSDAEVKTWLDNQSLLHWCPVYADDCGVVVLHENHDYYLAHVYVTQRESWVARAWGTKITPKLAKKLSVRFPILEN